MAVAEGTETWWLAGKEYPAKRGDVLYDESWGVNQFDFALSEGGRLRSLRAHRDLDKFRSAQIPEVRSQWFQAVPKSAE